MKRIFCFGLTIASLLASLDAGAAVAPSNADLAKEIQEIKQQNCQLQHEMDKLNRKVVCKKPLPRCCQLIDLSDPLYLKHRFPYFYSVVTQLSPRSASNVDHCFPGFCVSGMANFDLLMFDRRGSGFQPGSVVGVGIRPLFGEHQAQLIGSINNVNLFIDASVNKWSSFHFDFAYVNSSIKSETLSFHDKDNNTAYTNGASLKVNQAYLLMADPCLTPLFFQIGRFNAPFGDYNPYPIFESLTQLISEMRTGGLILGAIFPNGFYGMASWTMAEQSLRDFEGNTPLLDASPNYFDFSRNPGAKIGFRGCVRDAFLNINASYTYNIADANYINGIFLWGNKDLRNFVSEPIIRNQYFLLNRSAGVALHADGLYGCFAASADYVTALSNLNTGHENNGHIRAWGVDASVHFNPCGHPATFSLGYQGADHTDIFETTVACFGESCPIGPFGPFFLGTILPKIRYEASLMVSALTNINLGLAWINDRDFTTSNGGKGESSNFVKARINVNF